MPEMPNREMVMIPIKPSPEVKKIMDNICETLDKTIQPGTHNNQVLAALLFIFLDTVSDYPAVQQATISETPFSHVCQLLFDATGCSMTAPTPQGNLDTKH
jgi:hypothetical protein